MSIFWAGVRPLPTANPRLYFPNPGLKHRVRGSKNGGYRLDFCWPQLKLILDVDGLHKYFGAYRPTEEQIRRDFLRQRELEQAGWTVVRATWEELEKRPALITDRLRALGVGRAQ